MRIGVGIGWHCKNGDCSAMGGAGGSRSKHKEVWNNSGTDLYDISLRTPLEGGQHVPRTSDQVLDVAATPPRESDSTAIGLLPRADGSSVEMSSGPRQSISLDTVTVALRVCKSRGVDDGDKTLQRRASPSDGIANASI